MSYMIHELVITVFKAGLDNLIKNFSNKSSLTLKKVFNNFLVICGCLLAVGQAGVISGSLLAAAPAAVAVQPAAALSLPAATLALPTITTSTSNIIRGIGNLGAISAYTKSVDTPFSSVRKADVRVNNPGIVTATAVPASVVAVANTALAGTRLLRCRFTL
ncbi:hypothetical protein E2986_01934 [Frieseomelitta varia]|uniref:Uncharacterized protein n=1 Tax=Frieseomelitta varia TaxID=561572 RepID=A0A833SAS0_9HYME|nr:hypothetical protein E2986_01934 [Frieseomelitta varia]